MFVAKSYLVAGAALLFMTWVHTPLSVPLYAAQVPTSATISSAIVLGAESLQPDAAQSTRPLQSEPPVAVSSRLDSDCLHAAYGRNAAALALFDDATVRESMAQHYPLEPQRLTPKVGEHPGRIRSYALLGAVYGHTMKEVQGQLQTAYFMGQSLRLSGAAAAAFTRVGQRLTALAQEQPQLKSYMLPVGGFVWRTIAGEARLSPHSFGIAVDLNPSKGPYWLWTAPSRRASQSAAARASYPTSIVAAFEAEGFIWGGKWHEYDMMHFEYRPELICKAKALRDRLETPHAE